MRKVIESKTFASSSLASVLLIFLIILGVRVSKNSDSVRFSGVSAQELIQINREFQDTHSEVFKLTLENWISSKYWQELASPKTHLPQIVDEKNKTFHELFQYAETCNERLIKKIRPSKALTWHQYRCGKSKSLPGDFFSKPPYIHPNGTSFAYLGLKLLPDQLNTLEKKLALIPYVHALDLAKLETDLLNESQLKLAAIDRETLESFFKIEPIILQNDSNPKAASLWIVENETGYKSYRYQDWVKFLEKKHITALPYSANVTCVLRQGNLCLNPDCQGSYLRLGVINSILIGLSALLGVVLLFTLIKSIKKSRLEDEKRRFAFRMLVHELRTPITNLVLISENLRQTFDSLSTSAQDSVLDLFSQTDRLKNISSASQNYLRSESTNLIHLNSQKIESLKNYLELFLENSFKETTLKFDSEDFQIETDPYWFSLVLRNLLSNAYEHAAKPVVLKVTSSGHYFLIQVIDQGNWDGTQRSESQAKGLGIGLTITRQTVQALGGEIRFTPNPSTTTLKFLKVLKS